MLNVTIGNNMITPETLIKNGFKFRQYEGSKPYEGEYVKQTPQYRIELGYADLFDWNITINKWANCIKFSMSNVLKPSIDKINSVLEVCEIDFKLK